MEGSTEDSGHRKRSILSAEELFRWRKKEVLPVPQRGGVKDFEPDGSWLQAKRLEAFGEEHLSVLSEPRVEKSGNLVKGTWNSEVKLVNIERTGKFWMKMGFTESDRNWLYPEEALFLMEVNCLELLQHREVSLSLQEAYTLLLQPSGSITEKEYQVFAHLRRLGYIVLRHAGKLDVTSYEMKIGLHNYTKMKSKKSPGKSKHAETQQTITNKQVHPTDPGEEHKPQFSDNTIEENLVKDYSTDTRNTKNDSVSAHVCASQTSSGTRENCSENNNGRHSGEASDRSCDKSSLERVNVGYSKQSERAEQMDCVECGSSSEANSKDSSKCGQCSEEIKATCPEESCLADRKDHKRKGDGQESARFDSRSTEPRKKKNKMDSGIENSRSSFPEQNHIWTASDLWSVATRQSFKSQNISLPTEWDFSVIQFPDMGGTDTVSLPLPPSHCLPPNTCVDEDYEDVCMFDAEEYRQQRAIQSSAMDPDDDGKHLKQLEFSYAEWHKRNFRPVRARNWRQWKEGLRQRENSFLHDSPVAHLWQGEVTPLVQPQDSHSTDSLLQKLSVIQPYQGPFHTKERQEKPKISFDVYLPNTNFRKSNPGLPDHRVCVARGPEPPDAFSVHAATGHLDDRVPLHWAVVSSGDICFFVFDDVHLPVHPSSLG